MIQEISWNEIELIWREHLWPYRTTPIEPTSAMMWQAGYNIDNMEFEPTFFGYFYRKKLIGVNSGHLCMLDRDDTKGKHYRLSLIHI